MKFQAGKPYLLMSKENLSATEDILRQEVRKETKSRTKDERYS